MGVGKYAKQAIQWLIGAAKTIFDRNTEVSNFVASAKALGFESKMLNRFLLGIAKVEQHQGAHTSFWSKTEEAAKAGTVPEYTAEEIAYINQFKRVFDKNLKKPLQRLTRKANNEHAAGDGVAVEDHPVAIDPGDHDHEPFEQELPDQG